MTIRRRAASFSGSSCSFSGAFAVALAEGRDLRDAAEFATKAASLSVRKLGAHYQVPIYKHQRIRSPETMEFAVR